MPMPPAVLARRAVLVTLAVYLGYFVLVRVGLSADVCFIALMAAFYFVPGLVLRGDEARQRQFQVGPDSVIPPWSRRGLVVALVTMAVVFPLFIPGFFAFYEAACSESRGFLAPAFALERMTPLAGSLGDMLSGYCTTHNGGFWPSAVKLPHDWLQYFGGGFVMAAVLEVFAIALPEEVFHRGFLMSALEERYPPSVRILGVLLGRAAVLSSLLFAVGHLVGMAQVSRLLTFFPSLAFSWLWRRSGSLWAPALFHAASNLLMAVLMESTFRA